MIEYRKVILKGWLMNIKKYIEASIETKQAILKNDEIINKIDTIANVIVNAYKNGNKVLTAGNGGSAGDAQHIAGELVSKFSFDRPPLAAIELNTNSPLLTAISNDYGYEKSFARQIKANGKEGDVFIAISTSGHSINIVQAVEEANRLGIVTVGLVGNSECPLDKTCRYLIKVPSSYTPNVQESQIMIGHIICGLVEERMFTSN